MNDRSERSLKRDHDRMTDGSDSDPMDTSRGSASRSDPESSNDPMVVVTDKLAGLLSQERLKMPIMTRNAVEEEIHGVRCRAIEENPILVKRALKDFRRELKKAPDNKRRIYEMIESSVAERRREELQQRNANMIGQHFDMYQPPSPLLYNREKNYVTEDDNFRLRFLRCDLFDVKKAVERFLNYLNLANELWGFDIVSRRLVRREDFSKAEYKVLRKGYLQLLPFRDRSGRRVIVLSDDPSDPDFTKIDRKTRLKCFSYIVDVASRDSLESQRKGFVLVTEPNGMLCQIQNGFPFLGRLPAAFITRMAAGHHFVPDGMAYRMLGQNMVALRAAGLVSERVVRHKFYVGYSRLEMNYRLLSFGIPIEYMPSTDTGTIKVKFWSGWLKSRLLIESEKTENQALGIVECPGTKDVLFRHGQSYKKLIGNDTLREWIASELVNRKLPSLLSHQRESYTKTSIDQFGDRLIDEIESKQKGRFLKWDSNLNAWVRMLDKNEIKKKISASFYNYSKRNYEPMAQGLNMVTDDGSYKFIDGGKPTTDTCCGCDTRVVDDTRKSQKKSEK